MYTRGCILGLAALTPAVFLAFTLWADAPEEGRRYGLIVGVQNYDGSDLGNLKYCDNGAAGLAETLGKLGYRVTLLTRPE